MQGELRKTQTTPVPRGKGRGKEREVVVFSDVEGVPKDCPITKLSLRYPIP